LLNFIKYIPVPTAFKIIITKAIIEASRYCGTKNDTFTIGNNCAVATALIDIFPNVYVTSSQIFPFGMEYGNRSGLNIPLPLIAQQFIKLFDGFRLTPNLRLLLPEFEFNIDISDEVIEQINIDDVRALIKGDEKMPGYSAGFSYRVGAC
jgi:hypothetical protein